MAGRVAALSVTALLLARPAWAAPQSPRDQVAELNAIASTFVAEQLSYDPTAAYSTGLRAPDHRRWPDRRPAALRAYEAANDRLLARLGGIDPATLPAGEPQISYALLREQLQAERQARVCRAELWNVSHMSGWHLALASVAQEQPVGTADERAQALQRWAALPQVVDVEIENLRLGLAQGYSAPKSVVRRVIGQVDKLVAASGEDSPLASAAERAADPAFKAQFRTLITQSANPALARYRDYLRDEYLPEARDALGLSVLPNGAACYQASLRMFTTLNRTPQEVFDLGSRTVAANVATVQDQGQKLFGTRDFAQIVRRVRAAPDNHFKDVDEEVAFSRDVLARARTTSGGLFTSMPTQEVRVEPFLPYMRGSGASSFYERQADPSKPAFYRINTDHPEADTRADAEVTVVHEAFPGHHMQISYAQSLKQTDLARFSFNSAYVEGWARYAERLSEEAGIYRSPYTSITRRIWPARGMVADPGLHVLGWSREKTVQYLSDSGKFSTEQAEDLVDRMAVMPGQLTAYDSGGLEIMALRDEAKAALGGGFDLKRFNTAVLELGVVPLPALREHIQAWIRSQRGGATPTPGRM